MLDKSLFITDQIHARKVKLADGSEHQLHFKELSAIEFRKVVQAEISPDEEVRATSAAKLIAASLCTPDGKLALTFEQAQRLTTDAMQAIAAAVMEVNGIGISQKKT